MRNAPSVNHPRGRKRAFRTVNLNLIARLRENVPLDAYRHLADAVLDPIARRLSNVSPNALSASALVSAGFAGISFLFGGGWPLALGAFFVFLNALLDALDGKVAKITGKASRRGGF